MTRAAAKNTNQPMDKPGGLATAPTPRLGGGVVIEHPGEEAPNVADDTTPFDLPWRKHFVGDHALLTRGWPIAIRAALVELLDQQWRFGELPADPELLRIAIGASRREWMSGWPLLEAHFPLDADGLRRNQRLAIERERECDKRETSSKGGKKSAARRARLHAIDGGRIDGNDH